MDFVGGSEDERSPGPDLRCRAEVDRRRSVISDAAVEMLVVVEVEEVTAEGASDAIPASADQRGNSGLIRRLCCGPIPRNGDLKR